MMDYFREFISDKLCCCCENGIEKWSWSKIVVIACDSGARHLSKFWKEAAKFPNDLTLDDILQ